MKERILLLIIIIIGVLTMESCSSKSEKADLVLLNGEIVTLNKAMPEAEAIAVKSDTIMAIGKTVYIKNFIGNSTKVIDLNGKLAIPGFIDSHAHFLSIGEAKMNLDLNDAKNWPEIVAKVAEAALKVRPGQWIVGRGWNQEKWNPPVSQNVDGFPINNELNNATPLNPVMLIHASGHALIANKLAMKLAGVDSSTVDPPGGHIVRDTSGKPTGVFEENAEELILKAYNNYIENLPENIRKQRDETAAKLANEACLQNGITSLQDAGEPFDKIDFLKKLVGEHKINVRLYVMVYENNIDSLKKYLPKYKIIGYGNNHFTVRSLKLYIDGALGSRGALMLAPYNDKPGWSGLMTTSLKNLEAEMRIAFQDGFQVSTHAIGDKGNRLVLNLYQKIFGSKAKGNNFRWRIEHAQHLSNSDIPRFAGLNVIASMQGIHSTSDAGFVIKRIGKKRAESGAYAWRKLIDAGAIICNGTDAPVESLNPINNFYALISRKPANGKAFFPKEAMTRMEALKSYTINGAYAEFQEKIKGSLKVGKLADITVLSQNILKIPVQEILKTKIAYTIIGGKVLYKMTQ